MHSSDAYRHQATALQGELEIAQRQLVECRDKKPQSAGIVLPLPTVHLDERRQENSGQIWTFLIFLVDVGLLYFCCHHIMSEKSKSDLQKCAHDVVQHYLGRSHKQNVEVLSQQTLMAMLSGGAVGAFRIMESLAGTGLLGHFVRYLAITMRVCLLVLLALF